MATGSGMLTEHLWDQPSCWLDAGLLLQLLWNVIMWPVWKQTLIIIPGNNNTCGQKYVDSWRYRMRCQPPVCLLSLLHENQVSPQSPPVAHTLSDHPNRGCFHQQTWNRFNWFFNEILIICLQNITALNPLLTVRLQDNNQTDRQTQQVWLLWQVTVSWRILSELLRPTQDRFGWTQIFLFLIVRFGKSQTERFFNSSEQVNQKPPVTPGDTILKGYRYKPASSLCAELG